MAAAIPKSDVISGASLSNADLNRNKSASMQVLETSEAVRIKLVCFGCGRDARPWMMKQISVQNLYDEIDILVK